MEQKIRVFFERETMPEDCARRIESRFSQPSHPVSAAPLLRLSAGFAVFLLLAAMFLSSDRMVAFAECFYLRMDILRPMDNHPSHSVQGDYTIISKDSENSAHGTYQIQLLLPEDQDQKQPFFISDQEGMDIAVLHSGISAHSYAMLE